MHPNSRILGSGVMCLLIYPGSTSYTEAAVCNPNSNIYKKLLGMTLGEWVEIELNIMKVPIRVFLFPIFLFHEGAGGGEGPPKLGGCFFVGVCLLPQVNMNCSSGISMRVPGNKRAA